jgi:hypothetical protein
MYNHGYIKDGKNPLVPPIKHSFFKVFETIGGNGSFIPTFCFCKKSKLLVLVRFFPIFQDCDVAMLVII